MVKPGFKQTEVGEIPEDWDVKELGELAHFKNGKAHENDIKDDGKYIVVNSKFISTEGEVKKYSNCCHCSTSENNILMVMSDVPNGRAIAKCYLVDAPNKYTVNQRICSLQITKDNPRYIFYILNRNPYYLSFDDGVKQTNLRKDDVLSCPIGVPKFVEEQKAIAKALSDVDELIVSLEKLIAKKRDIKTATMQQLLTGKTRLPGFNGAWNPVRMETDANLKARIGWQALTTKEYLDSGSFYLVTGTDFVDGRVNWSTCHFVDEWRYVQDRNIQLKEGDVLLTKDGTIGKVGYVDHLELPATLNSGVFVIRPINNKFDPLFLYYVLSSRIFDEFLAKITAGSTITHLYQKDFINFGFLAPDLDEQEEIARTLDAMDSELTVILKQLEKVKSIKQGMMQELLTGRTRLVDVSTHQVEQERKHGT